MANEQKEPEFLFTMQDIVKTMQRMKAIEAEQGNIPITAEERTAFTAKMATDLADLKLLCHLYDISSKYGVVSVQTIKSYIEKLEAMLGLPQNIHKWRG